MYQIIFLILGIYEPIFLYVKTNLMNEWMEGLDIIFSLKNLLLFISSLERWFRFFFFFWLLSLVALNL